MFMSFKPQVLDQSPVYQTLAYLSCSSCPLFSPTHHPPAPPLLKEPITCNLLVCLGYVLIKTVVERAGEPHFLKHLSNVVEPSWANIPPPYPPLFPFRAALHASIKCLSPHCMGSLRGETLSPALGTWPGIY